MVSKTKVIAILTALTIPVFGVLTIKNTTTFFRELSNGTSNVTAKANNDMLQQKFVKVRDRANTMLNTQVSPYSESEIYEKISKISAKVVVINVSYSVNDIPTNEADKVNEESKEQAEKTTAETQNDKASQQKTAEPPTKKTSASSSSSVAFITVRGDVFNFLNDLDSKLSYHVVKIYQLNGKYEAVIRVGGSAE